VNYRKVYAWIIKKALSEHRSKKNMRDIDYTYYENHHILPKSLFPLFRNRKLNLVLLTAREHFFCHQLLTKVYPCKEMDMALWKMAHSKGQNSGYITSHEYERLRTNIVLLGVNQGKRTKGRKVSKETVQRLVDSHKNPSEEIRNRHKSIMRSLWQIPEYRDKMVSAHRGFKASPNSRISRSIAMRDLQWWNDGVRNVRAQVIPETGWKKGKIGKGSHREVICVETGEIFLSKKSFMEYLKKIGVSGWSTIDLELSLYGKSFSKRLNCTFAYTP
jgi:hypothetical protein